MNDTKPIVESGEMEGGRWVSIVHPVDIGEQAALTLAERETNVTGWVFKTRGEKRRGQYVYLLLLTDQETPSPDWDMLANGAS